jgi:hypothetical protein
LLQIAACPDITAKKQLLTCNSELVKTVNVFMLAS